MNGKRKANRQKRQERILDFITTNVATKGYPPSVREIAKALGIKSTSTVHRYLKSLEDMGLIHRKPRLPRTIEIPHGQTIPVPLVGRVTAGLPILAVQNIDARIPLPSDLWHLDQNCFILRIQGHSMAGAGILDGDFIIARQQDYANNGDIVVARLGDEATVKRFYRYRDVVRLQPENPNMDPIITKDVKILGRVIGLFRAY